MEYWRWWVVHLWVEGFFEVFATAALALVFARLGPRAKRARRRRGASRRRALFLFAGIPGTFHHLYFSGTPTLDHGASARAFSALEVVPLVLIGLEAYQHQPHAARRAVDGSATAGRAGACQHGQPRSSGSWGKRRPRSSLRVEDATGSRATSSGRAHRKRSGSSGKGARSRAL